LQLQTKKRCEGLFQHCFLSLVLYSLLPFFTLPPCFLFLPLCFSPPSPMFSSSRFPSLSRLFNSSLLLLFVVQCWCVCDG
jgi:hypothetical protein